MPSCTDKGEYDFGGLKEYISCKPWRECTKDKSEIKMFRTTQSLVSQTVNQLCNRNAILEKVGVTEKQLHAVLSLRLNRNTSPLFVSVLIDREVRAENILKNNLGNYIMNPNRLNAVADERKEIDSSVTEHMIDSIDQTDSLKGVVKKVERSKLVNSRSPSLEKLEPEDDVIDKSQIKRRGRRKKNTKIEEDNEEDEEEIDERSSSSSQGKAEQDDDDKPLAKRRGRKRGRKSKIEEEDYDYDEEGNEGSLSSQDKLEVEEEDIKPIVKRKGRKRGRKPKMEEEEDDDEEDGNEGSLSSQDKIEVEEEENAKPLVKKRGRKKKMVKEEDEEEDEEEPYEASQSLSLKEKRSSRVVVTTNNGRRIIRKITKYDPSEYYLTPLIRKKAKCVVVEQPKKRLKRGRPPLKPKVEATTPSCKKPEQLRCYSRSGRASTEVDKPLTPKTLLSEKKIQEKMNHIKDKDSDDEEEIKIESKYNNMPALVPVKSKASMLKNECFLCSKPADVTDECSVLACSLCLNIAHSDCVDDGFYKHLKKWRCSQCIFNHPAVCSTCGKEYDKSDGVMVTCDHCEEMFHARCHVPQLKRAVPTAPWRCSFCPRITIPDTLIGAREDLKNSVGTYAFNIVGKKLKPLLEICLLEPQVNKEESATVPQPQPQVEIPPVKISTEDLPPEPPTEAPSLLEPVKIKTEPVEQVEETIVEPKEEEPVVPASYKYHRPGEPIPTVDEWTAKQVADYFSIRFGPAVGNAFLSQEIDGRSLKLLRRSDVIDSLGLQFGIALKVLYYVKKIQLGTNVIHELWA